MNVAGRKRSTVDLRRGLATFLLATVFASAPMPATAVEVGFGKADLTPAIEKGKPVWIAGYGNNRAAEGVHDKLWARAVVLREGSNKIALVSVDLVGFMYPNTKSVRKTLSDYAYVLVASTHNHEGPDTIGLWGRTPAESGVDPNYLAFAEKRIVEAVRSAEAGLTEAVAEYGTAEDESLLRDSRLPIAKDGVLRAVRFKSKSEGKSIGILVQWNSHPESLEDRNTLITADFPYYTVSALEQRHRCPIAYFSGAVGGLMTVPEDRLKRPDGSFLKGGDFALAHVYGDAVADLADKALEKPEQATLSPLKASAKPIGLPLGNPRFRAGRAIGVLARPAFGWKGDMYDLGEKLSDRHVVGEIALETEVAYIRLGEIHIAAIPGELYPELVYGKYQEPVEPNVDFPTAPLEPPAMKSLPGSKTLLFGLANDEVGYIVPKRQWDDVAPFAYGRTSKQYGEVNSIGHEAAPILMKALADRVRDASEK